MSINNYLSNVCKCWPAMSLGAGIMYNRRRKNNRLACDNTPRPFFLKHTPKTLIYWSLPASQQESIFCPNNVYMFTSLKFYIKNTQLQTRKIKTTNISRFIFLFVHWVVVVISQYIAKASSDYSGTRRTLTVWSQLVLFTRSPCGWPSHGHVESGK